MKYLLYVVQGRCAAARVRLKDGVNSLGRRDDCVIRVRSSQVSRHHCELFEAAGKLIVRDLGSSNGTHVNGIRIANQHVLMPGDLLTIGSVTFRVEVRGQTAAPPATARAGAAAKIKASQPAGLHAPPTEAKDAEEVVIQLEEESELIDLIALDDVDSRKPAHGKPARAEAKGAKSPPVPLVKAPSHTTQPPKKTMPKREEDEDKSLTGFLMGLQLDDED
jgi:predicted component of type VI protein secretion system